MPQKKKKMYLALCSTNKSLNFPSYKTRLEPPKAHYLLSKSASRQLPTSFSRHIHSPRKQKTASSRGRSMRYLTFYSPQKGMTETGGPTHKSTHQHGSSFGFRRCPRGGHGPRLHLVAVAGNDAGSFRGREPLASHALELEDFRLQNLPFALELLELLLSRRRQDGRHQGLK